MIGECRPYKSSILKQGLSIFQKQAQCYNGVILEGILGEVGRSASVFAFELMVALPYYTAVLAVRVSHLGTELLSAITAENLSREGALTHRALVCLFAPMEFTLYHIPFCGVNNDEVAVSHVILRNFTFVNLHRLGKVVGGKMFLKPSITFVFLIRII